MPVIRIIQIQKKRSLDGDFGKTNDHTSPEPPKKQSKQSDDKDKSIQLDNKQEDTQTNTTSSDKETKFNSMQPSPYPGR